MNWTRALIAGVLAGIAINIVDFILHGQILGATYARYPEVFSQESANPLFFLLVAVLIGIAAGILFAKTRGSWKAGWVGGVTFGFWLGLISFFVPFYNPLVLDGFPYYLSWCWGGINLIDGVVGGAVLGAVYKSA